MIKHLHIENYALIAHLDLDMQSGFSVITGETGAGKSIILGAIGLLLGQRADSKSIKTGATRCIVEAEFDLSRYDFKQFFTDNDLDYEPSECMIRRELTSAGKSRAFINDTPVQLTLLKELGEQLIDIHSQHKNLLLGKEDFQLNVIDVLAQTSGQLTAYRKEFRLYRDLCHQLEDTVASARQNHENEEFMRYQFKELDEANLQEGEQAELEAEIETLEHAEEIKQALYHASGILQNPSDGTDALQLVRQAHSALSDICGVYPESEPLTERLNSCYIELKDIYGEIESASDSIDYNPERLQYVNDRLNAIYSLQKKHHVDTAEELIEIKRTLEHNLLIIDNSDEFIEEIRRQCNEQRAKTLEVATKLSEMRRTAAKALEEAMVAGLQPLGMPNVQFLAEIATTDLTPQGIDSITFLFTANKASTPQPISKVASGGEIARVMLVLKSLIAGAVKLPTIIFDEIDTGVSGSIAEKMARIMREMGDHDRQVISITHLPQIAALGNIQYKVYKEDNEEETLSHIILLNHEQRVEELAHMLSGETITEAALQNAEALLSK